MQKKLLLKDYTSIASMLFGLFFGAGNLIFPVYVGQLAGRNVWPATIGPFFAIPRTATVSFEVGVAPLLPEGSARIWLALFSLLFFAAVLWFSLRPSKILTWVGKILNPIFLIFLGILVISALMNPIGSISTIPVAEIYQSSSFFKDFLEGYNTMDALASLAFGIVVIKVIQNLGVENPNTVAADTVKSGFFSMTIMAIIYISLTIIGAQSRGLYEVASNGGEALALISRHYFGNVGAIILAITMIFACMKTAIGLITSCSETFATLFPRSLSYKGYAIVFCLVSFGIANIGLSNIISFSIPVLMFSYPLAITLILLSLFHRFFKGAQCIYVSVTAFTIVAAIFDLFKALPNNAKDSLGLNGVLNLASKYLPFFDIGLGWVVPSIMGLVVGIFIYLLSMKKTANNSYAAS